MSDNDIRISFTEQEVYDMATSYSFPDEIRVKFEAHVKPEYPEGTVAWVTYDDDVRYLGCRVDGGWTHSSEGADDLFDRWVKKVEPLRVLADDEAAVDAEVLSSLASMWLQSANTRADITARYGPLAHRLDQITVDAEATS